MRIKSFRKEKSNQFYFRIFDKNEKQILRSEAYNSKAARDNGIASFKKNSANSDMYERKTAADGSFFFNVKAANGQVVSTSVMFKSEEEREAVIQSILNYAGGASKTKAATKLTTEKTESKEQDDYMAAAFYQDSGTDTASGFDKFQKGVGNLHYFSFKSDDGKVLLLSQGYTAESGRDNGISSVEKNSKNENRFGTHTEGDKFYFTLKAGNHQEIARSVDFDSAEDMTRAISIIMAGEGSFAPPAKVKASSASTESSKSKEQDDYMSLGFYQESGTDTKSGFDKFQKGDEGLHYFTFKSDDGEVLLLSQGYTAEAGRDNGISSVEKNGKIEGRYTAHSEDGKFYFTLKAGNHQEIARSVDFDSEEDMARAINIIRSGGGAMAAATIVKASSADTDSGTKEQDDYMSLDFYKSSGSGLDKGFDKFQAGDLHYFTYNGGGDVILFSQGYTAEAGRDNGIESVTKNSKIEKRYNTHSEDGKFYFTLKAGNHQEIGRSRDYDSEADMKAAMGLMMAAGGGAVSSSSSRSVSSSDSSSSSSSSESKGEAIALASSGAAAGAAAGGMVKSSSKSTKTEKEDDYLPCKAYEGHPVNDKVNNVAFFKHENGQYYFVVYKADGSVRLRSEGFGSAKERDVELSGMLKNINNPEMYNSIKSGKYAIHVLKDATGREVGRSCLEKEGEAAVVTTVEETTKVAEEETAVPVEAIAATAVAGAAATTVVTSETKKEKEDDYLPCKAYEGHKINDKQNGVAFFKHENGQYYFVVYKEDGSVRLRSEGFESAKERDVELSGMLKNLNNTDMYTTIKRGKYSIHILKDADGREVGRSCLEKEEVAAPVVTETVAPVVVEETSTVETVAATAVAGAAAATVVSSSSSETVDPPKPVEKEDDYLPCKEYEGHKVNDKENNVAFFKHKNGQFYFAIYYNDGSVRLRSEGFTSAKERDSELSGALKGLNNKDMYETLRKGKYYMNVLKDKTGREVGRSCLQKESKPVVPKEAVAVAAAVAAPIVKEVVTSKTVTTRKRVEVEDDYLPCKAYQGHNVTDKKNNIAFFKHENGQHYFVVYKKNGKVKLRSEGFASKEDMQGELKAVIKHMNTKRNYSKIEAQGGKYVIHVLKDDNGKEVGRSCLEKVKQAAPIVASAAAAAVVAASTTKVETVEEVIKPEPVVVKETPKKVIATAAAAAAGAGGAAKAAAATTASSGGFKLWWLLPLLLLPLLFFWWKGCDTNKAAVVAPPVKEVVAEKPAPEPVKEVAPPPAPSCPYNCSGGTRAASPVFNIPSNAIPKSLTRLGTSPEFGNSHNMSPSQFFDKLKGAAGANGRDKQFLDQVFKGLGYGGFGDATADMFSDVTLSPGTTGNMGFGGSKHRTIYATLNTSGKDLQAFKIKGANGCNIHFMKTCGNHFFFCPK